MKWGHCKVMNYSFFRLGEIPEFFPYQNSYQYIFTLPIRHTAPFRSLNKEIKNFIVVTRFISVAVFLFKNFLFKKKNYRHY